MIEFRNKFNSPASADKIKTYYKLLELHNNGAISMADMEGELTTFSVAVSHTN